MDAHNNLQRWLGLAAPLDYNGTRQALDRWQLYGGLIFFHLLLDRIAQAGYLPDDGPGRP
jgi:DNA-3-methyladenine glycosylase II